jgi:hypothetical protein
MRERNLILKSAMKPFSENFTMISMYFLKRCIAIPNQIKKTFLVKHGNKIVAEMHYIQLIYSK